MDTIANPQERNTGFIDPVEALNRPEMKELSELATTKFRARSRHYETECLMPAENLRELCERGWLTASLSKAIGGKGSNLDTDDPATYLQGIRMIARGCGSTAHCMQLNNHTNWMIETIGTEDQKERFLKPQLKKPLLVTGVGSEPTRRNMYVMSTVARPQPDGGYIIDGIKNYATNAPMMVGGVIFASLEGVEHWTENHVMVLVEPGQEGMEIDSEWYRPAGMRAAVSPLITLKNVHIPKKNVLGKPGDYPRQRWQGKYHLGFAANYLGVAEGIFDWCCQYMVQKGKAKDPLILLRVGELKVGLQQAAATFHDAIRSWKTAPVVQAELLSMGAKYAAARIALDVCDKVTGLAGSTALFEEYPLGRAISNVQTHIQHAGHDRTAQIIGQAALGLEFDSTLQR